MVIWVWLVEEGAGGRERARRGYWVHMKMAGTGTGTGANRTTRQLMPCVGGGWMIWEEELFMFRIHTGSGLDGKDGLMTMRLRHL